MITEYDPLQAPDPDQWLALDESERINLVSEYHRGAEEEMPNVHLHAIIHAVVENQIAMGDEYPVQKTLQRLVREGLDRHNGIHAIGSVLMKYLWEVGSVEIMAESSSNDYFKEIDQLTAQKWLDEYQ